MVSKLIPFEIILGDQLSTEYGSSNEFELTSPAQP